MSVSDETALKLATEVERLRVAIRKHRDQRGDDRCWLDDEELYGALPEGYEPPDRDTTVELNNCERFIRNRRNPNIIYDSPEREIETLKQNISSAAVIETALRCSLKIKLGVAYQVRKVLGEAWTDIGHWIQIAERQFAEIHPARAPSTAGIEASRRIRERIGDAINNMRLFIEPDSEQTPS